MCNNKVIEFVIEDGNASYVMEETDKRTKYLSGAVRFSTFREAFELMVNISKDKDDVAQPIFVRPIETVLKVID